MGQGRRRCGGALGTTLMRRGRRAGGAASLNVYVFGEEYWTLIGLKGASAAGAAAMLWKVGGSRRDKSPICLSWRTDILNTGGSIVERILAMICIVTSPDHAMRQPFFVFFIPNPATVRAHDGEGGRTKSVERGCTSYRLISSLVHTAPAPPKRLLWTVQRG